jgi:HEPN domain-containing protein
MINETDAQEWLAYAEADRQAAEHLLESGDYMACAFHCQQAVEKLLKAIIVAETQKRPPYLHNLRLLLEQISTVEFPEDIVRKTVWIEPHYLGTRYPGVVYSRFYNRQNLERLLAETLEVYQWFLIKLNEMSKSRGS